MLTGLDTGFFFALQEQNPDAIRIWQERETITSVIVLYEPCLSGSFPKWWIGDHDIRATPLLRSTVRTSDMVVSGRFRPRSGFIRRFSPYRAIQAVSWGRDDVLGGNRIGMVRTTEEISEREIQGVANDYFGYKRSSRRHAD